MPRKKHYHRQTKHIVQNTDSLKDIIIEKEKVDLAKFVRVSVIIRDKRVELAIYLDLTAAPPSLYRYLFEIFGLTRQEIQKQIMEQASQKDAISYLEFERTKMGTIRCEFLPKCLLAIQARYPEIIHLDNVLRVNEILEKKRRHLI